MSLENPAITRHEPGAWRFWAIAALAGFSGLISHGGFPGSVVALVPATIVALLISEGWGHRWLLFAVAGSITALGLAPGPLNLVVTWLLLTAWAASQKGEEFSDLTGTAFHLCGQLLERPVTELRTMKSARSDGRAVRFDFRQLIVPVVAAMTFAILLGIANPVLESVFNAISMDGVADHVGAVSLVVGLLAFLALRAITATTASSGPGLAVDGAAPPWHQQYFSPLAVALSLFALNLMFLAHNGLDLSYLWQGVTLPAGLSHADYVHRGAYALIATAIAAAAFVIFALWPGSRSEASAPVRLLVYVWLMQTVMLVASSIARTFAYIDAYGMTTWRLAGLAWMALVAVGLVFIALRIALGRSNLWLLNRNILAALAVLWFSGFTDFASITANYNVRRALALPGEAEKLDIAYLQSLGPSAIPALKRFADEQLAAARRINPGHPAPVISIYDPPLLQLRVQQADWRRWTIRNAMIASEVREALQ